MSEKPEGWHVDRTLSVGNVVTTVVAVAAMLWFFADQDQRITENALNIKHAESTSIERDRVLEQRQREAEQRSATTVARIDAKLDKIYEILRQR